MTDNPYHSLPPVTNWIAGFLIALLTLMLPLSMVMGARVKSNYIKPATNAAAQLKHNSS